MSRSNIGLFFTVVFVSLAGCNAPPEVTYERPPSTSPTTTSSAHATSASPVGTSSRSTKHVVPPSPKPVPKSALITVPFTSQAPFANWNDPYQEACEEASVIMVHHYLSQTPLSPETADREIVDLAAWEAANGYTQDVTLEELSDIVEKVYGYQSTVIENPTIEDIEGFVARGFPVILPAAGRDLGNPYFSGEGPWYHMLVVIGFDSDEFITNDPGTKRGSGYHYAKHVLMSAIHDWTGEKEEIRTGKPKALVLFQGKP